MGREGVYLRKAVYSDLLLIFNWANDSETRSSSFDTHIISIEEHISWFDRMMEDDNQAQYILMREDEAVGQIRLRIENCKAELSYSIDRKNRHSGYGKEIIKLIKQQVRQDYPQVRILVGKVKAKNEASAKCFSANGFNETYRQFEFELS